MPWSGKFNRGEREQVVIFACLQNEEACVENARIDKRSTKLAALEKLIRSAKEQIIDIEHDNTLIISQLPRVDFVQSEDEALLKTVLVSVRILDVLHDYYSCTLVRSAVSQLHAYVSKCTYSVDFLLITEVVVKLLTYKVFCQCCGTLAEAMTTRSASTSSFFKVPNITRAAT